MSVTACFTQVARNGLSKKLFSPCIGTIAVRHGSVWEPDYLILGKTKTPEYDLVNVQIKSFDFAILENYQRLIHKLARLMEINVNDCWATPSQDLKVSKFKANTSVAETEYKLKVYERNVQVIDVKSHILPLFIDTLVTTCPPSVKISVHEHSPEITENRYVPDLEVLELREQLDDMKGGPKKKKTNK